jgi:hypothetical protein
MPQLAEDCDTLRQPPRGRQAQTKMPTDPPAGLIPVLLKGTILPLTEAEYRRAIFRGKWRRQIALARRVAKAVTTSPPPAPHTP